MPKNNHDPRKTARSRRQGELRTISHHGRIRGGIRGHGSGLGRAVSLFGSAGTRPQNNYYRAAEQTSRLLAKAGFAVITGGGPGIMEAGNKGAYEAGGTSIGLNITLPQEQEANKYQTISVGFPLFLRTQSNVREICVGVGLLPGGYGTLDEFFETITLVQTLQSRGVPHHSVWL